MAKSKRGRPSKTAEQKLRDALERTAPGQHVIAKRELWGFVTPTKGPEGRGGSIDQDICDGIGQLHALGLFDGHGHDPQDMRDKGREWRNHFVVILKASGFKMGNYQRMDKAKTLVQYTHADQRFDCMDEALTGYERHVLYSLLIDPIVGSWPDGQENPPWVQSLICEGLLKRGKRPPFIRFPSSDDRGRLDATIRGLCVLIDASLPARWERAA